MGTVYDYRRRGAGEYIPSLFSLAIGDGAQHREGLGRGGAAYVDLDGIAAHLGDDAGEKYGRSPFSTDGSVAARRNPERTTVPIFLFSALRRRRLEAEAGERVE